MDLRIERIVVVPGSAEDVWAAITEPALLSSWFGAQGSIDPRTGGRCEFTFPDGTRRDALVQAVEPGKRLRFRWLPFERRTDGSLWRRASTTVDIAIDSAAGETTVSIVEFDEVQPLVPTRYGA